MASQPRSGLPQFWTTTLAKALSGDQPCQLVTWLNGHTRLEKRPGREGSLANWKAKHSAMLTETTERYAADGWKCDKERFFRVEGQAAILSGKADLIIQKPNCRPKIVDVKSGGHRDSDASQVLIEMIAIPLAWNAPQMTFAGEVIYGDHIVALHPDQAAELKPKLFALLRKLGTMARPSASPSQSACRFCDVSDEDCAERFREESEPLASTVEF